MTTSIGPTRRRTTVVSMTIAMCLVGVGVSVAGVGASQPVQAQSSGTTPEGAASVASSGVSQTLVLYARPALSGVVDPFRPPAHVGGPGNRGLEYGGTDGQVVAAAADGLVLFVGPVAGREVITIQHADGIRTTYTGLGEIWVQPGQSVSRYSAIAVAAGNLHFGARLGDQYLDPQILIDASITVERARLIPQPP